MPGLPFHLTVKLSLVISETISLSGIGVGEGTKPGGVGVAVGGSVSKPTLTSYAL